ncbi:MAG: hypothetical protein KF842_10665 [Caulobacter sp.]|nr:hypothetical protein [Caulobacter sp.]
MRLAPLLVCLGLCLAGPVAAAPPAITIETPDGGFFQVQTLPFKAGDHWRYLSETRLTEVGGDHPGAQSNNQTFDLEVVRVEADGQPVFRYTLRSVVIVDERQPGIQEIMAAFVGVPVEFRTVNGVYPGVTLNGADVRKQVFANLKTTATDEAGARVALEGLFKDLESRADGLSVWMAGDVNNLAGMHLPRIPNKPFVMPTRTETLADGSTMVADGGMKIDAVDQARCEITYSRNSRFRIAATGYDEALVTQATLAADALPVTLTQTKTRTAPAGYAFRETLTMTRQTAAPGCS